MTSRSFKMDLAASRQPKIIEQWNDFWKEKYPNYSVCRDIPLELDRLGVDVILRNERFHKMLVDEKITHEKYPDYPIEIMSNAEKKHDGWGYTSRGLFIAIAKHNDAYEFVGLPIVFEITPCFTPRILNNPNFETRVLETDGLYHSIIKRVPKEHLLNYNDNGWWETRYGKETKLWMYP